MPCARAELVRARISTDKRCFIDLHRWAPREPPKEATASSSGGSPKLEKGCPFSRAPNGAGAGAMWFIYLSYLDEMAFICRESWFQTLDGGVGGVRTRS